MAGSDDAPIRPALAVSAGHVRPTDAPAAEGSASESQGPSVRRSAAILLLVVVALAVAFVEFRDGLPYPLQPPPGAAVLGDDSARRSPSPPVPSDRPTPDPSTTPSASEAAPTATATPSATPQATSTQPPRPSSDRYAVLEPCPDQAGCWLYTIRRGDNLFSIAHWFGVPLEVVRRWNPWTSTQGVDPGREIRLPQPTR